jgi:hypothetical protein
VVVWFFFVYTNKNTTTPPIVSRDNGTEFANSQNENGILNRKNPETVDKKGKNKP